MGSLYCIDSSALIDLGRVYPPSIFPTLWDKLGDLIQSERLMAPEGVRDKPDDVVRMWANDQVGMFVPHASLQSAVADVLRMARLDGVDLNRVDQSNEADIWVVALAYSGNPIVVSYESIKGTNTPQAQATCPVAQGIRIPLDTDRRVFTPIDRSSYTWEREYARRTAVERVNSVASRCGSCWVWLSDASGSSTRNSSGV
jgi:hypothetical protein